MLPKYPGKYVLSYNYAVELYNYIYAGDSKPADAAAAMEKLENALKQTLAAKKDYPEADVLMSRHLYNYMFDTQDEQRAIKGSTPADQKKRADLKAKIVETAEKMIPYAEAAYNIYSSKETLRPIEKGNFKMATDFLVTAYEMKGDKAKSEEYKKKLDAIN